MLSGNIVSPPSPQELHKQLLGIPNTPQGNQFLAGIIANDKSIKGGIAAAILNLRQKPAPVPFPAEGTVVDGLIQRAQDPFGQAPQEQAPQEQAPQEQAPQEQAPQEQAPQENQAAMGIAQPGLEEQAQDSTMATGGLVAFNHGGAIRGFSEGRVAENELADAAPHFIPSGLTNWVQSMLSPSPGRPRDEMKRAQAEEREIAARTPPGVVETALKAIMSPSPGNRPAEAKEPESNQKPTKTEQPKTEQPKVDQKSIQTKLGVDPSDSGMPKAQHAANVDKTFKESLEDKKDAATESPGYSTPMQNSPENDQYATPPATAEPTSSAGKADSYDAKIRAMMDIYGVPPNIAAELYSEKEHALAKDKSIHLIQDLAAGIGAALMHKPGVTGTGGRYKSDISGAIGTGLMALVANRAQSEQAEGAAQNAMDELKVKSKMNEYEARKEAAKAVVSQEAAAAAEARDWERKQAEIALRGDFEIRAAEAMSGLREPQTNAVRANYARLAADSEYEAAMKNGENPDYATILEKHRLQLGLPPSGSGGYGDYSNGPLNNNGTLTVLRQGILR